MFQTRSLSTGFLVASLGIAAGLAFIGSPSVASAGDCDGLKLPEVQAVCAKGGKKAVKDAMNAAVKASSDKSLKCSSCHENQDTYKQKSNSEADFKKLMAPNFKYVEKK
jgi:hypothetical protein